MRAFLLGLLATAPGCLFTSNNVNVGQVPRATMPFATGAPDTGVAELTAGASALPSVTKPKSTSLGSGAELPDAQIRAEGRFRLTNNFYLGAMYERGVGHRQVDPALPTLSSGNVSGFGVLLGGSIPLGADPNLRLGWTATATHWTVPYDQYSTVTLDVLGHVVGVAQVVSSDTGSTSTLGLGLWPSYKFGQLRVFGGGYLTQRPTVHLFTKDSTYIDPLLVASASQDVVDNDEVDLVVGAGAEYLVTPELSLTAIANQEVLGSVMRLGPSLQLGISVRIGDRGPTTR